MQEAFIDQQAAQCAFCMNGMIMGAVGWIESRIAAGNRTVPSREETADFLSGALPGHTVQLHLPVRCPPPHPRCDP